MKAFRIGLLTAALAAGPATAQGLITPGGGATHLSMAGTSTAVGVDAIGALYWNPAVISGLKNSEVVIGSSLIIPHNGVTSTVPAGAFGPLGPAVTQSGRTNSDNGLVPLTAIGVVYKTDDPRLTYGIGLSSLAAGGVNYPGDAANPILAPRGPLNQFILGPQGASMTTVQIAPTVSYQVSDSLAVGVGPIVDICAVSFDPAFFGPTSQARVIDPKQFPTGSHTRPFWGGGFRAGVTYKATEHLTAGLSYSSPQWFETWEFNARDANGDALQYSTQFSLPQIFSVGVAYDGIERLLLATDVRYFDYRNTKLLGQAPVDGGAGWNSIWAVSLGAKYQVSDRLSVQAGYLFNGNPVPNNLTLFNTQLPTITEHTLAVGSCFQINDSIGLSLAYLHGFENTTGGTVIPALGANTTLDMKYDSINFGLHIKFGGPKCKEACACEAATTTTTSVPTPSVLPAPGPAAL